MPLIRFLLAAFLLHSTLVAENAEVRFFAFNLGAPSGDYRLKQTKSEAETNVILIESNRFTERIPVAAGSYQLYPPDSITGVSFTIPAKSKHWIFLVFPAENAAGVALVPIQDDPASFKAGDRWILNTSRVHVKIEIGNESLALAPGASRTIRPKPRSDGRQPVRMLHEVKEKWKPFNSTWWPFDPEVRSMIVIYDDPDHKRLRVKSISDIPKS